MKTSPPCCDKTYRQSFIRIILKALKKCKDSDPIQLDFNPEEESVIEYYLKDVARESVLTNTSVEECIGIFIARLERLVKGERMEWERIREIIKNNARDLTPEEIIEFDNLSHYFHRINSRQAQC